MKRLLPICLTLSCASLFTGCLFFRKSAKPKEDPAIAANVEATFKQRWVDKRTGELKAAGLAPAAAQAQAEAEFSERYNFTSAAKK